MRLPLHDILCICLLSVLIRLSQACPERCVCFKSTVRCMFLQLDHIPEIPTETTILDLRFNKIKNIPPHSFTQLKELTTLLLNNNDIQSIDNEAFEGLDNLKFLYLYKNHIKTIGSVAFHGLANLEQLFLHNNQIKRLPKDVFDPLNSLRRLRLDANPLICDCEMLWLQDLLERKHDVLEAAATCQYPKELKEKDIIAISPQEINCRKPKLSVLPEDVEVQRGNTARFVCRAEGQPTPKIEWRKNMKELMPNNVLSSGRLNVQSDGTLVISNTQDSDKGVYECIATNTAGLTASNPVQLRFYGDRERPQIMSRTEDIRAKAGDAKIELQCLVSGEPTPDIAWFKNDLDLPSDPRFTQRPREGVLAIRNVRYSDRGLYRCKASNVEGSTSANIRVVISVPPAFTERPQDLDIVEGQSGFFLCSAEGTPAPKLSWYFEGRHLTSGGRFTVSAQGNTLWITKVLLADNGEIECRAESESGIASAVSTVTVKPRAAPTLDQAPEDVWAGEGSDVEFVCEVTADPIASIRWLKNGAPLQTSNKYTIMRNEESLKVSNVSPADEGIYECVAQNVVGSVRAFARLFLAAGSGRRPNRPGTHNQITEPRITNNVINQTVTNARNEVNRAFDNTLNRLHDRNRPKTPEDLFALFRLPSTSDALQVSRSAEVFERTLQKLHNQLYQRTRYNITHEELNYEEFLTPFQLAIIANLSGCMTHRHVVSCDDMCYHHKYRTYDGTCNNLAHPMWGASLTALTRLIPPRYENGFNTPVGWDTEREYNGYFLPSPREVSLKVMSANRVEDDDTYTHMLMQWGQFLDHDISFTPQAASNARFSDGRYCNETCTNQAPCFPIRIPDDDPRITRHRCMGMTRSSAMCGSGMTSVFFQNVAQREQINQITSYIDASNIYGSSEGEARNLRDFPINSGYLRAGHIMPSGKPLLPPNVGEPVDCQMDPNKAHVPCFQAGDHRANEQLGLLSMHTLWMREHNRVAETLRVYNPHWDGDMLYHESRKVVGAQMQHITYTEWLPKILGPKGMEALGEYGGYNPTTNAQMFNSFSTAAFRFGHTLINPIIYRLNETFEPIPQGNLPLHKAFFAPFRLVEEGGVDPVIRGLFGRSSKKVNPGDFLNEELTEKLFKLAHEVSLDLAALNIQRGRDHGLPSYNIYREICGLPAVDSFDDLVREISNYQLRRKLRDVYGHPDNIDLWVGALSEDLVEGSKLGPTLMCLLVDQFKRLRDGDRLWYENPGVFSATQASAIKQSSLARVVCDNSDFIGQVQKDVFLKAEFPQGFLECDSDDIPKLNLNAWAHCCHSCDRAGSFSSVTSHFRGRRSVDQTFSDDPYAHTRHRPGSFFSEPQLGPDDLSMEEIKKLEMMKQAQMEADAESRKLEMMKQAQMEAEQQARKLEMMKQAQIEADQQARKLEMMKQAQMEAEAEAARKFEMMKQAQMEADRIASRINIDPSQLSMKELKKLEMMKQAQMEAEQQALKLEMMKKAQMEAEARKLAMMNAQNSPDMMELKKLQMLQAQGVELTMEQQKTLMMLEKQAMMNGQTQTNIDDNDPDMMELKKLQMLQAQGIELTMEQLKQLAMLEKLVMMKQSSSGQSQAVIDESDEELMELKKLQMLQAQGVPLTMEQVKRMDMLQQILESSFEIGQPSITNTNFVDMDKLKAMNKASNGGMSDHMKEHMQVMEQEMMEHMVHMEHEMMDHVDVRMEGVEDVMVNMEQTVHRLHKKVRRLERQLKHSRPPSQPSSKSVCLDNTGQTKQNKETWKEGDCRSCVCKHGMVECDTENCPLPGCDSPQKIPGKCCLTCP